jgi:TRAP-type uncharacterized transport system fused permease subunit
MATGVSAVKSGIVMFVIPFVFALYPELLLIDAAIIDPAVSTSGAVTYLPGYDGTRDIAGLVFLLIRVVVALYLLASALAGFDRVTLSPQMAAVRLAIAVLILARIDVIAWSAVAIALLVLVMHARLRRNLREHFR